MYKPPINSKMTGAAFDRWHEVEPIAAAQWLNDKLGQAEQTDAAHHDLQAANELELQCEEAELPIRHSVYSSTHYMR